jgi:curved DNA-binding protein CbpA
MLNQNDENIYFEDYYAVLGVNPNASIKEITNKYRLLVKSVHPDAGGNHEDFIYIKKIFEILSTPHLKQEYDRKFFSHIKHNRDLSLKNLLKRLVNFKPRHFSFYLLLMTFIPFFSIILYSSLLTREPMIVVPINEKNSENLSMENPLQPTASPNDDVNDETSPKASPTQKPKASPTQNPKASPTQNPKASPTQNPKASPTQNPKASPSLKPTATPINTEQTNNSSQPLPSPQSTVIQVKEVIVKSTSKTAPSMPTALVPKNDIFKLIQYYAENGKINYAFINGDKYEGGFFEDMFEGQGSYTFANGNKYTGEFKDNIITGKGTSQYANGDIYNGNWLNDKRHLQGTYIFANGDKYVGEFNNDLIFGVGTYNYANGDKYTGQWLNGQKYYRGTYLFANNDKYIGEFRNDLINGSGTMIWANGDTYAGQWENGKQHGQGTLTMKNGRIYKGQWVFGKFIQNE